MLGRVQRAGAAVLVDAKGDEGEERAEDDGRLHHAVVVELAKKLGAADAPLVELRLVDLAVAESDWFLLAKDGLVSQSIVRIVQE